MGNNPWTNLDPYGQWAWDGDFIEYGVGGLLGFHGGDVAGAAWGGAAEGATGGATIVADTFTFGQFDSLNAAANSYQGSDYMVSRILAVGSREVAITAATLGVGTLAANGVRGAGMVHKGVLAYEALDTGYTVGTGAAQMYNGDYAGGAMNMAFGAMGAGGAARSLRTAKKARALSRGCNCFEGETLVQTSAGTVPIAEVAVGDEVYSLNEETGDVELALVTNLFKRTVQSIYRVEVAGEVIETTREHPFYVEGQGWTEAQDLRDGVLVITQDGFTLPITDIEVVYEPTTVYNFSVNGNHNYYVSEDGVLVHNVGCTLPRAMPGPRTKTKKPGKRGPSTDPDAPHNKMIRELGDELVAKHNLILAGGGRMKEKLLRTLGGHKSGRRPDILYQTPDGKIRAINVGRTTAAGSPVPRELEALEDLNDIAKIPTRFVRYD